MMFNCLMIIAGIYVLISLVSHILNIYKFFFEEKVEIIAVEEKHKLEE